MALNREQLKQRLIEIFSQEDTESNIEDVAEQISEAIEDFVKEARIVYSSGLTSSNGIVSGNFNGHLE